MAYDGKPHRNATYRSDRGKKETADLLRFPWMLYLEPSAIFLFLTPLA
jgi:hypothetical protein